MADKVRVLNRTRRGDRKDSVEFAFQTSTAVVATYDFSL